MTELKRKWMTRLFPRVLLIFTGFTLTILGAFLFRYIRENYVLPIHAGVIEAEASPGAEGVEQEEPNLPPLELEEAEAPIEEEAVPEEPVPNLQPVTQAYIDQLYKAKEEKIVYLTFDDGPSPNITPGVLEVLREEEIKATFFVLGKQAALYPQLIEEIHQDGHVIGNHSYTHLYKKVYKSHQSFLEEIQETEGVLKGILGEDYDLRLIRFPGGSFGNSKASYREFINEQGYVYVDWNTVNGDGEVAVPSHDYIMSRFLRTSGGKNILVVLMHDSAAKKTTLETLPQIIKHLKEAGYRFEVLPRMMEVPEEEEVAWTQDQGHN